MYRLLAAALAFGLFLPSAWAAGDGKDKLELDVKGKLSADDPKDKLLKKSPHKVHELKMKAKLIYVIDLKSTDFDALLRLEDSTGQQLALNDDASPDTLDSRIIFKAPKDDAYRIIATSFDGKSGAYTLTVRQGTEDDIKKSDPFFTLLDKPAPDIIGEYAVQGTTKKLSDLKGKVVLVDFWAVWCQPCIATFPHLREWDTKYKKDGLEILGVTTYYQQFGFDKDKGSLIRIGKDDKKIDLKPAEEHEMIKDFLAFHKLSHQIMTVSKEGNLTTGKDYSVRGIPQAVLIDRKGIVRMVRVGSGEANAAALEEEIRKLLAEK